MHSGEGLFQHLMANTLLYHPLASAILYQYSVYIIKHVNIAGKDI